MPRHAHDAAIGREPEAAGLVVDDLEQRVDRQSLREPERGHAPVAIPHEAAVGRDPQRAVGVFVEIEHVLRVVHRVQVDRLDASVDDARRAVRRADPDCAVACDVQREDEIARQTRLGTVGAEHAVLHVHEPA